MIENITCPHCRFRHPANRSCEEAKRLADEAREKREKLKEEVSKDEIVLFSELIHESLT